MQSVWKYDIEIKDEIKIIMPKGAEILKVQAQNGKPKMWALVYLENEKITETRTFIIRGTGHKIEEFRGEYIDTFQVYDGKLVFHIFETYDN